MKRIGTSACNRVVVGAALCLLLAGCARRGLVLELSGSIIYDKPEIVEVTHTLADTRLQGGAVVIHVRMAADPGLQAFFDVSPDVAHNQPMREVDSGRYIGDYSFPIELTGGPFTVIGRVRHEKAGEVSLKDPEPITIPLAIPPQ